MNNHLKHFSIFTLTVLAFFVYFGIYHGARSNSAGDVSGYAWEGDLNEGQKDPGGLGWLSFHCANNNNCPLNGGYGVNINIPDDGGKGVFLGFSNKEPVDMNGYAWSGNYPDYNHNNYQDLPTEATSGYGWLRFGPFSDEESRDIPKSTFNEAHGAQFVSEIGNDANSIGYLTGWARFCAVYARGCSGETKEINGSELGGWDGWLSLKGQNYSVILDSKGFFTGYAWGGDDNGSNNVGWVDFSRVKVGRVDPSSLVLKANGVESPSILYITPSTNIVTLTWMGLNLKTPSYGDAVGDDIDNWVSNKNPKPCPKNGETITYNPPFGLKMQEGEFRTYTLKCFKSDGVTEVSSSVRVQMKADVPSLSLTVKNGGNVISVYPKTEITLSSTGSFLQSVAGSANNNGDINWEGVKSCPSSKSVDYTFTPTISVGDQKDYFITCTANDGTTPVISSTVTIKMCENGDSVCHGASNIKKTPKYIER